MPGTNVNEIGPNGLTPFLAVAGGHDGPLEARVELIRFLLERGANIEAVQQVFLSYCETLNKEYDESLEDEAFILRPRPGGHGNTRTLAIEFNSTAPAVSTVLIEAGVNMYQSRAGSLEPIDKAYALRSHRYTWSPGSTACPCCWRWSSWAPM